MVSIPTPGATTSRSEGDERRGSALPGSKGVYVVVIMMYRRKFQ